MRVRTPNSRSRSWSLTVWTKSVAFVVAALCMAFTEGQGPSVWQTGTTDEVLKAADDLVDPDLGQATVPDYPESVGIDNTSGSRTHGRVDPGLLCGLCFDLGSLPAHVAFAWAAPNATYGPGDHGWHDEVYFGTPPCDFSHGLCVSAPRDGTTFVQADARGVTESIAQATAEQDVALLATLLTLPEVLVNAERGAIQLTGCDGMSIVAHVPVGRDLLRAAEVLAAQAPDSES